MSVVLSCFAKFSELFGTAHKPSQHPVELMNEKNPVLIQIALPRCYSNKKMIVTSVSFYSK